MDYGACATVSRNKLIPAAENKRKFTLRNPSEKTITKVKVDGCLKLEGKRCDYLFEIDQPTSKVIYLELKGGDTEEALKQLVSTLGHFNQQHQSCEKVLCIVAASNSPQFGTALQHKKAELRKLKVKAENVKRFTNQGQLDI